MKPGGSSISWCARGGGGWKPLPARQPHPVPLLSSPLAWGRRVDAFQFQAVRIAEKHRVVAAPIVVLRVVGRCVEHRAMNSAHHFIHTIHFLAAIHGPGDVM